MPEPWGCRDSSVRKIGAPVSAIPRSAEEGAAVRSPRAFSTPLPHSGFPCSGLFAVVLLALPLPQNFFVDFETSRKIHREVTTAQWTELTPVVKPCPPLAFPEVH